MINVSLDRGTSEDNNKYLFSKSNPTLFFLFLFEIVFFLKSYLNCSPIIKNQSVFFPFIKLYHQSISQINFSVDSFSNLNKYIQLDMIFFRYTCSEDRIMDGRYNYSIEYLNNEERVDFDANRNNSFRNIFQRFYLNSIPDTVLYSPITKFNKIQSNITVNTNLTELKGISFDYFYSNSNFILLFDYLSAFFTVISIITIIRLLFNSCKSNKAFFEFSTNDKFLVFLNFLTILSVLNYQYLNNDIKVFKITILFTDMLIVFFSVYSLYLLDSLTSGTSIISQQVLTDISRYILFFLAILYNDHINFESKIYARSNEKIIVSFPMIKMIVLFFHFWHTSNCALYLFKALKVTNKHSKNAVVKCAPWIIFTLINTFVVRFILTFHFFNENSSLDLFVYRLSYVIASIFIVNLSILSNQESDQYQLVADISDGNGGNMENSLLPINDNEFEEVDN